VRQSGAIRSVAGSGGSSSRSSRRERIGANYNGWWLLPLGIFTASALCALGILVFRPAFVEHSYAAVFGPVPSGEEAAVQCSGPLANDYSCYQKRYQDLVYGSGVEAALAELKDEFAKEPFVKSNCHQLTHVIGRTAAKLYDGDVASTYGRGDDFCASGYYHGAMETVVADIGADKIREEADGICAAPREQQEQSLNHRNCAHGLGHGFMGLYQNDLFESLDACGYLSDRFERDQCSGGVFMQNVMDEDNPSTPSKHLKADDPFYPCPEVDSEYKDQCFLRQTVYALRKQGNDFAKVFELCGRIEDGYRDSCYVGLGNNAAAQSTKNYTTDEAQTQFIDGQCMQGQDVEAQSKCLGAAATQLVFYYDSDVQAKALCGSLTSPDWRTACLQRVAGYVADRRR
jgi:hypothetical protein